MDGHASTQGSQPRTQSDSPPRVAQLQAILLSFIQGPPKNRLWLDTMLSIADTTEDDDNRIYQARFCCSAKAFSELVKSLSASHASLPHSFGLSVFTTAPSAHAAEAPHHPPERRPLATFSSDWLRRFEAAPWRIGDDIHNLRLFLQDFAFSQHASLASGRSVEVSRHLFTAPQDNFTRAFYGPALRLLLAHILTHNKLFHSASADPLRLDAPPAPATAPTTTTTTTTTTDGPRLYHSKVLPIIQSSGYGKTRMCVQLSTISPGMLVCLRPTPAPMDATVTSFPPQDASVHSWLATCARLASSDKPNQPPDVESENLAHLGVLAWLTSYCNTIAHYIHHLKSLSRCWQPSSPCANTDHILCWRTLVHHLALAIHSPQSGFVPHQLFRTPPQVCPHSHLARIAAHAANAFASSATAAAAHLDDAPDPDDNPSASPPPPPPPLLFHTADLRAQMLKYTVDVADALKSTLEVDPLFQLDRPEAYLDAIHNHLVPAVDRLEQSAPRAEADALFFLALDECSSVEKLLPVIRRVWSHAHPKRTWILLIDTNSDLAPLAGAVARASSRRLDTTHRLTHPFSAMPSNVNFTNQDRRALLACRSQPLTLRQLNAWLPKLGRPLWHDTMYHGSGVIHPDAIIGKLVMPASWQWPPDDDASWAMLDEDNQNLLALASRRVLVELSATSDTKTWHRFVSQQIAQHLRYVGRISSDTEAIVSSVPSEPPLSLAAAWFFRCVPTRTAHNWSLVIRSLVDAKSHIGVNTGAEGEQGVAVMASMALDLAVSDRYANVLRGSLQPWPQDSIKYTAIYGLVSVSDWLGRFVGSNFALAASVAPSSPWTGDANNDVEMGARGGDDDNNNDDDDDALAAFRRWAAASWINTTHIGHLREQVSQHRAMSQDQLLELWLRHAAAQGVSNQPGWDLLIPVYEHGSSTPPADDQLLEPSKLSYVAIQVKNGITRPRQEVRDAPIGPPLGGDGHDQGARQCLEMFIDLRGSSNEGGPIYSRRMHREADSTSSSVGGSTTSPGQVRHHLSVSGLGVATFPVLDCLTGPAKRAVALLFGSAHTMGMHMFDDGLARHARAQDEAFQRAYADVQLDIMARLAPLTPEAA